MLAFMREFIPQLELVHSTEHPWLTPDCHRAARQKAATAGTDHFGEFALQCSDTLFQACPA
eukprot:9717777-Alexandrium_andersonii.AAC.1